MSSFIRIYEVRRNSTDSFQLPLPRLNRGLGQHILGAVRSNRYDFVRCSCRNGQTCPRCQHRQAVSLEDVPQITISIADAIERALEGEEQQQASNNNVAVIPEYKAEATLDDDCSICMDKIKTNQKFRALPCSEVKQHCFHTKCIDQWLQRNNSCPVCRAKVL